MIYYAILVFVTIIIMTYDNYAILVLVTIITYDNNWHTGIGHHIILTNNIMPYWYRSPYYDSQLCHIGIGQPMTLCHSIDPLQTHLFPLLAYSNHCYPPCWGTYTSMTAQISKRMVGFLPGYFASLWSEASKERLYNDCFERVLHYSSTEKNYFWQLDW